MHTTLIYNNLHAFLMQNRKMHKTKLVQEQEQVETSKSKSIRIYTSTHKLLWKISQAENRLLNQEVDFLVGERFSVLKKQGRVSD
jgi:hypothetical protein